MFTILSINATYMDVIPYCHEISLHLEIRLPLKYLRIFQPIHRNKCRPWNLTTWYRINNDLHMCTRVIHAYKMYPYVQTCPVPSIIFLTLICSSASSLLVRQWMLRRPYQTQPTGNHFKSHSWSFSVTKDFTFTKSVNKFIPGAIELLLYRLHDCIVFRNDTTALFTAQLCLQLYTICFWEGNRVRTRLLFDAIDSGAEPVWEYYIWWDKTFLFGLGYQGLTAFLNAQHFYSWLFTNLTYWWLRYAHVLCHLC